MHEKIRSNMWIFVGKCIYFMLFDIVSFGGWNKFRTFKSEGLTLHFFNSSKDYIYDDFTSDCQKMSISPLKNFLLQSHAHADDSTGHPLFADSFTYGSWDLNNWLMLR